jgi:hypothetical protein
MPSLRFFVALALLAVGHAARAEYILSVPEAAAHVGAPLRANLTILNDSDAPLRVELPTPLNARLETERSVAQFNLTPDRSGASLSFRMVRFARSGAPTWAAASGTERMYSARAA